MALFRCTLGLLALLLISDCSWAEEKDLSVSELLWRANKDVVYRKDEPLVIDDIAYVNENERNADPCTSDGVCMWPKSTTYGKVYVPYVISEEYSSREYGIISRAMGVFSSLTCIRFVRRSSQRDYLNIQPGSGCYSYVGHIGNSQTLSLDRQGCVYGNIVQHMVLHALGFNHEQSRSDRDQYIRVLWENIQSGREHAFKKINTLNQDTPYDYGSVMQYHRYAFSGNNKPTLQPIPDANIYLGNATAMSQKDIDRVNRLYKCKIRQHSGAGED